MSFWFHQGPPIQKPSRSKNPTHAHTEPKMPAQLRPGVFFWVHFGHAFWNKYLTPRCWICWLASFVKSSLLSQQPRGYNGKSQSTMFGMLVFVWCMVPRNVVFDWSQRVCVPKTDCLANFIPTIPIPNRIHMTVGASTTVERNRYTQHHPEIVVRDPVAEHFLNNTL